LSEEPKGVNIILPSCFGGELTVNGGIPGVELEYRKRIKEFIYKTAIEMEIDVPDMVVGLIPISFEVCLETLNTEHYDEAMNSYHDLWHDFFNGAMDDTVKNSIIKIDLESGRHAFDPDKKKKGEMDWS